MTLPSRPWDDIYLVGKDMNRIHELNEQIAIKTAWGLQLGFAIDQAKADGDAATIGDSILKIDKLRMEVRDLIDERKLLVNGGPDGLDD